ncbi:hypothetical protein [Leifsonia aquatica]|uniref:hypothetical protein n=1 Tax=Leifsonia aquatica TaxID=144185 RepID=UPI00046AFA56|nr:hypothetical protein [Leifsonia aquatica]
MSIFESEHAYKKPGLTLAESLGLDIPDNAPGGQPLRSPNGTGLNRLSERARRASAIMESGFYDLDAYQRSA